MPTTAAAIDGLTFAYTTVYLDPADEPAQLVALADVDLRAMLKEADLITGHQLCGEPVEGVRDVRAHDAAVVHGENVLHAAGQPQTA